MALDELYVTPEGSRKKRVEIVAQLCAGCGVCAEICPAGAITEVSE